MLDQRQFVVALTRKPNAAAAREIPAIEWDRYISHLTNLWQKKIANNRQATQDFSQDVLQKLANPTPQDTAAITALIAPPAPAGGVAPAPDPAAIAAALNTQFRTAVYNNAAFNVAAERLAKARQTFRDRHIDLVDAMHAYLSGLHTSRAQRKLLGLNFMEAANPDSREQYDKAKAAFLAEIEKYHTDLLSELDEVLISEFGDILGAQVNPMRNPADQIRTAAQAAMASFERTYTRAAGADPDYDAARNTLEIAVDYYLPEELVQVIKNQATVTTTGGAVRAVNAVDIVSVGEVQAALRGAATPAQQAAALAVLLENNARNELVQHTRASAAIYDNPSRNVGDAAQSIYNNNAVEEIKRGIAARRAGGGLINFLRTDRGTLDILQNDFYKLNPAIAKLNQKLADGSFVDGAPAKVAEIEAILNEPSLRQRAAQESFTHFHNRHAAVALRAGPGGAITVEPPKHYETVNIGKDFQVTFKAPALADLSGTSLSEDARRGLLQRNISEMFEVKQLRGFHIWENRQKIYLALAKELMNYLKRHDNLLYKDSPFQFFPIYTTDPDKYRDQRMMQLAIGAALKATNQKFVGLDEASFNEKEKKLWNKNLADLTQDGMTSAAAIEQRPTP